MATFVLPDKWSEDLKDESGNPMSKRCGLPPSAAGEKKWLPFACPAATQAPSIGFGLDETL